ncbi:dihydropteroate synthase [Calderihabitans maritimus]|uniref:Dihydropteroate synthase n=1 Tax=Calderihabitans maritimus TaxID=1246530 RepID=A0A1Z5HSB5_9FIRM|nr:dihydropteroate synthase [Calderihabitans maritimus]GAW92215.1 dihydropteroate synthase [Calderihabitans maritimus]
MDLSTYNVRVLRVDDLEEAKGAIKAVGADAGGIKLMSPKAVFRLVKVSDVPIKAANIIKQEMLSRGGEAALSRGAVDNSIDKTDVLLMGTLKQFEQLIYKLRMQPFGLPKLAEEIELVLKNVEPRKTSVLRCRDKSLLLGERTLIMGILNVTPDSFSDGGKYNTLEAAVERARLMVEEGADIIDLGGESTRPGASYVPAEEEMNRVLPVLERLVQELEVPISVDTYKAETARAALERGAHIINDVWGLKADPAMAEVVAEYDVPVVVMHNQKGTEYRDLMGDIVRALKESIDLAKAKGVAPDKIIIDPGIGFGKNTDQNLEVMKRLGELKSLGKPILLGTSRKSMIGNTLGLPVEERLEGTAATVAVGIMQGVDIVRVHDVKEMVRVARMTDAMIRR